MTAQVRDEEIQILEQEIFTLRNRLRGSRSRPVDGLDDLFEGKVAELSKLRSQRGQERRAEIEGEVDVEAWNRLVDVEKAERDFTRNMMRSFKGLGASELKPGEGI